MNNDLFQIRVTDQNLDFTLSANTEAELERKLIDWYLEIGDFEETISMVKSRVSVEIEIVKADYDNEAGL